MSRGWFAGAPMVAVEVASRGNSPDGLEWKTQLYLANGALEVWAVYGKTRSVVVHSGTQTARYRDRFVSAAIDGTVDVPDFF
jgi:Uma2 family endonuclease